MNKFLATLLACTFATSVFAKDIDETIDAASDGHVDISNIAGSVTVKGWNKSSVRVTGTLGRNVEELVLESDGDKVHIKVKVPKSGNRSIDTDLVISVPRNSSLDVGTVSADIDVSDVMGEQSLHTVSGDVTTQQADANVGAESVSGDVRITGNESDGETNASSVSGDVYLSRVSGEVKATSVSGDIDVTQGSFARANLETVNGDIEFQSELRKGGKLKIDTVNGDVDVVFVGDVSATFDIDTFNGGIKNCFGPKAERTSKYSPGTELQFSEGGGDGRVVISTLNGKISLCRK
jgi:DUF4097 and DUF4098 domain-containing protein YvlB